MNWPDAPPFISSAFFDGNIGAYTSTDAKPIKNGLIVIVFVTVNRALERSHRLSEQNQLFSEPIGESAPGVEGRSVLSTLTNECRWAAIKGSRLHPSRFLGPK